jgi:hypothetical protein
MDLSSFSGTTVTPLKTAPFKIKGEVTPSVKEEFAGTVGAKTDQMLSVWQAESPAVSAPVPAW